jgi:hypothetical protein
MKVEKFKKLYDLIISKLPDEFDIKIGSNGVVDKIVSFDVYPDDKELILWSANSDPESGDKKEEN